MKKKLLITLSILTLLAPLTSCSQSDNKESTLATFLTSLRKGLKIEGKVYEKANYLESEGGAETGEFVETSFDVLYRFKNEDGAQAERYIATDDEVLTHDICKEGIDGNIYYVDINEHNEVQENIATDSYGNSINYGQILDNPFAYLLESDFTLVEGSKTLYNLENKKATFVASRLLGVADTIFDAYCENAQLSLDGDKITLSLIPKTIYGYATDSSYNNVYYKLSANATLTISEIGSSNITFPTPYEHKAEHDTLKSAFEAINNNYTLDLHYVANDDGTINTVDYKIYVTEKGAFLKFSSGDTIDAASDVYCKNISNKIVAYGYDVTSNSWTIDAAKSNGLSDMNGLDITSVTSTFDVASEIFTYDQSKDQYTLENDIVDYIGAVAFIPAILQEQYLNGYGESCSIKLNNGILNEIKVVSLYENTWISRQETYTLSYSNIGSTVLPYDLGNL